MMHHDVTSCWSTIWWWNIIRGKGYTVLTSKVFNILYRNYCNLKKVHVLLTHPVLWDKMLIWSYNCWIVKARVNIVKKWKANQKSILRIPFNRQKSLYVLAQVSVTCRIALIAPNFFKHNNELLKKMCISTIVNSNIYCILLSPKLASLWILVFNNSFLFILRYFIHKYDWFDHVKWEIHQLIKVVIFMA